MKQILVVFGTRPEAIKMAPVITALRSRAGLEVRVGVTAQHREMLDQVLDLFHIVPDFDLNVMRPDQSLGELTSRMIVGLSSCFADLKPDLVLVHGDTTTTFATSLAAFYGRIAVGHVEAGLRTGDIYAPWPEEMNRRLTSCIASLNFAPTSAARANLLAEGVASNSVHVTGNTVVDALMHVVERINHDPAIRSELDKTFDFLRKDKKVILVTGHRRENFGAGFQNICAALAQIADRFPEVEIVYPVHLNPSVRGPVLKLLSNISNIHLIEPVEYLSFVYLMQRSALVVTDSGGVQEEAPSLFKPVLVMRDKTERPEGVKAGTARLVGTNVDAIVDSVVLELMNTGSMLNQTFPPNPYGDGRAAERIASVVAASTLDEHATYGKAANI
jgi:UDP-N-acetylglucosamine 2-epimerase (non-hydrolysing)